MRSSDFQYHVYNLQNKNWDKASRISVYLSFGNSDMQLTADTVEL